MKQGTHQEKGGEQGKGGRVLWVVGVGNWGKGKIGAAKKKKEVIFRI